MVDAALNARLQVHLTAVGHDLNTARFVDRITHKRQAVPVRLACIVYACVYPRALFGMLCRGNV